MNKNIFYYFSQHFALHTIAMNYFLLNLQFNYIIKSLFEYIIRANGVPTQITDRN